MVEEITGILDKIDVQLGDLTKAIDGADAKLIELEDRLAATEDPGLQAKLSEVIDRLTASLDAMEAEHGKIQTFRREAAAQLDALRTVHEGTQQ